MKSTHGVSTAFHMIFPKRMCHRFHKALHVPNRRSHTVPHRSPYLHVLITQFDFALAASWFRQSDSTQSRSQDERHGFHFGGQERSRCDTSKGCTHGEWSQLVFPARLQDKGWRSSDEGSGGRKPEGPPAKPTRCGASQAAVEEGRGRVGQSVLVCFKVSQMARAPPTLIQTRVAQEARRAMRRKPWTRGPR